MVVKIELHFYYVSYAVYFYIQRGKSDKIMKKSKL